MMAQRQLTAPTRRQALVLSVLFLGLLLAGRLIATALLAALGPAWIGPRGGMLVGLVFMVLLPALALLPLLPRAIHPPPRLRAVGALMLAIAIPTGFMAAAAAQLATIGALELAGWPGLEAARLHVVELYGVLLRFDGAANIVGTFFLVSVLGPIIEEFAFRGVLQRLLEEAAGPGVAIVGSALLFAALHFEPLGFVPRTLIGLGCGIAAHRLRSLIPAMAIHAAFNSLSLGLALAFGAPTALGVHSPPPSSLLPGIAVTLVTGVAFLSLIALAPVAVPHATQPPA